jgi:Dullard-like phosphatase family protein
LEKVPKLPPQSGSLDGAFTLVLDLDETLVHYFEQNGIGGFNRRPGMFEFLQRMNELHYEIVIFTAATQDYADWVIDQIDPNRLVHYRLYRQHAMPWGPLFAKELSRLGRDLDKTLIIDNVQENFMMQPQNGIFIATWYDDPQDTALFELTPLLEELIVTQARVPDILGKYREQIPAWAGFGPSWDLTDSGFDEQQDIPPMPQRQQQPVNVPGAGQGAGMAQQGMMQPVEQPAARVMGTGPSPAYAQPGVHQASSMTTPSHMINNSNSGYPDHQGQPWPQSAVPKHAGPASQQRPAMTYSGIAGPYQASQSVPTRPAFSGIAGPYQAPLTRPAV